MTSTVAMGSSVGGSIEDVDLQQRQRAQYLKVRTLVLLGAALPGLGAYFCLAYTFLLQPHRISNFTNTDCPGIQSSFPPVSYSIGVWEPQRFVWLFVLCTHIPPRLFFLLIFSHTFIGSAVTESSREGWYSGVMWFYVRTLWLEPIGLLSVSVIDIESHFLLHAISYAVWLTAFNFNMLFNLILHHFSGARQATKTCKRTFYVKLWMFITGCALSLSTAVSYPLFLVYCFEAGYIAFSIAEYIIVGYNSLFYVLTYIEMPNGRVELFVDARWTNGENAPPAPVKRALPSLSSSDSSSTACSTAALCVGIVPLANEKRRLSSPESARLRQPSP